jgi:hypothetical protein
MMMTVMIPLALVLAPSHFTAAVLFAVFASIVFAITQRSGMREQVRYGLYCFAMFVGGVFVAGWVMLLLRR